MFAIVYGILGDDDNGELFIDGPYFHQSESNFDRAEILARELASTKTKNQIIPWVFELKKDETVPQAMIRIQDGWFQKFKVRTMETYQTIQKDQFNATCPFNEVCFDNFMTYYLKEEDKPVFGNIKRHLDI